MKEMWIPEIIFKAGFKHLRNTCPEIYSVFALKKGKIIKIKTNIAIKYSRTEEKKR